MIDERKITSKQKLLLTMLGIFCFGNMFSAIFVNTFLYASAQINQLQVVIMYNLLFFITIALVAPITCYVGKKISPVFAMLAGIIGYAILYIVLILMRDVAAHYVILLGILGGLSPSLVFVPYNVLAIELSTNKNLDTYQSIQGIAITLPAVVAPFISGYLIQNFSGTTGYIISFSLSFILFTVSAIIVSRLPFMKTTTKIYLMSAILMPFRNESVRNVTVGETLRGIREGAMGFLLNILIFSIIKDTSLVGRYNLVAGLFQVVSFYVIGKVIYPQNRKKFMLVGSLVLFFSYFLFFANLSITTIFIYGIVNAIFIPAVNNTTVSYYYRTINSLPNSKKRNMEFFSVREAYLNFGRVFGVLLLFVVPKQTNYLIYAMLAIGATQLVMYYFYAKAEKSIK